MQQKQEKVPEEDPRVDIPRDRISNWMRRDPPLLNHPRAAAQDREIVPTWVLNLQQIDLGDATAGAISLEGGELNQLGCCLRLVVEAGPPPVVQRQRRE